MSSYFWISTSSQDPTIGANWQKSDNTTGTAPSAGDDVFIQAIPGSSLANIWAAGSSNLAAPTGLSTSGGATTGGNLAQSTTYYYYVSAINASGESPVSAELTYVIGATGTATNTVTVNWSIVTGATGYKIYRATSTGAELYLASVGAVLLYADTSATVPAGSPPGTFTLNSLTISQTYSGSIGAAGTQGYWKVSATTWTIGTPATDGSNPTGSGLIKLDFGTVQFTGTTLASGSSSTVGQLPIQIKGTHASNKLYVIGGSVGVATNQPGEVSTISILNVVGPNSLCTCGSGVTLTTVSVSSGATFTASSAIATLTISPSSTATTNGSVLIGTSNNGGTHYLNQRASTCVTTLNLYGTGTANFTGNPASAIVATFNWYAGGRVSTDPANPGHITFTTTSMINGGTRILS